MHESDGIGTAGSGEGLEPCPSSPPRGLKEILADVERTVILAALRDSGGNKAGAARSLGITERLMGLRVRRLGIDWRSLRPSRHRSPRRP